MLNQGPACRLLSNKTWTVNAVPQPESGHAHPEGKVQPGSGRCEGEGKGEANSREGWATVLAGVQECCPPGQTHGWAHLRDLSPPTPGNSSLSSHLEEVLTYFQLAETCYHELLLNFAFHTYVKSLLYSLNVVISIHFFNILFI